MTFFAKVVFLLALAVFGITAFDKNIRISDLAGCRELVLDGYNNYQLTVPISSFSNNVVNPNEKLRMKFYVIGYEIIIQFLNSKNNIDLFSAIAGYERRFCNIGYADTGAFVVPPADCLKHTNSFYYTEFTLVLTKGKILKL